MPRGVPGSGNGPRDGDDKSYYEGLNRQIEKRQQLKKQKLEQEKQKNNGTQTRVRENQRP